MALSTIIRGVCGKVGIPVPAAIATSTDPQIVQLLAIANEEVEEAISRHDWSALRSTAIRPVTSVASGVGFVSWPDGFARFSVDGAPFQVGTRLPLVGPASSFDWSTMTTGLRPTTSVSWRRTDGGMQFVGVSSGDQVQFDYMSDRAILPQMGDPKPAFDTDTDTGRISERLIRLGIIWRWKQTKGLEYGEDMSTYERELERAANADTGPQVITMADPYRDAAALTTPIVVVAGT